MIIAIVIGVSCLFWIIAAILFVCAKGVDRRISESKKDCVEKTTATVVDVEEVYKRNVDTYNYTWYPAYEFYVNGERVVQKSVIGTEKNSVQTGQQTILYYNPENPHMIYVPAENQTSVSTILKIIGIAFVICGCLAGIIGFVVSKNMYTYSVRYLRTDDTGSDNIMNNIYIPHLKWEPMQSQSVT